MTMPNDKKSESSEEPRGEEQNVDVDDQDVDAEETPEGEESTPEPTIEDLQKELEILQSRLRRANRQAAERRIQLKEFKGKSTPTPPEKEAPVQDSELQGELARARSELRVLRMTEALSAELDALNISFASAQARTDTLAFAREEVVKELDDTAPDKEDLQDILKGVLRTRTYLTAPRKKPVETDSKKRGKSDSVAIDEDELAKRFGIRPL